MKTSHLICALVLAGWASALSPAHIGAKSIRESGLTKLTHDLTETLVIDASNVHLDCDNHHIKQTGGRSNTIGIQVYKQHNVWIENCHIHGFTYGIPHNQQSRHTSSQEYSARRRDEQGSRRV